MKKRGAHVSEYTAHAKMSPHLAMLSNSRPKKKCPRAPLFSFFIRLRQRCNQQITYAFTWQDEKTAANSVVGSSDRRRLKVKGLVEGLLKEGGEGKVYVGRER